MKKILIPLTAFVFLWVIAGLVMNKYPLFAQEEENIDIFKSRYPYFSIQDEDIYPMWVILHMDQDEIEIYYENLAEAIILSELSVVSVEEGVILLRELRSDIIDGVDIDIDRYDQGGMMGRRGYVRSCHSIYFDDDDSYSWIYLHSDDETRDQMDQELVIELQSLSLSELSIDELAEFIVASESLIANTYIRNNE